MKINTLSVIFVAIVGSLFLTACGSTTSISRTTTKANVRSQRVIKNSPEVRMTLLADSKKATGSKSRGHNQNKRDSDKHSVSIDQNRHEIKKPQPSEKTNAEIGEFTSSIEQNNADSSVEPTPFAVPNDSEKNHTTLPKVTEQTADTKKNGGNEATFNQNGAALMMETSPEAKASVSPSSTTAKAIIAGSNDQLFSPTPLPSPTSKLDSPTPGKETAIAQNQTPATTTEPLTRAQAEALRDSNNPIDQAKGQLGLAKLDANANSQPNPVSKPDIDAPPKPTPKQTFALIQEQSLKVTAEIPHKSQGVITSFRKAVGKFGRGLGKVKTNIKELISWKSVLLWFGIMALLILTFFVWRKRKSLAPSKFPSFIRKRNELDEPRRSPWKFMEDTWGFWYWKIRDARDRRRGIEMPKFQQSVAEGSGPAVASDQILPTAETTKVQRTVHGVSVASTVHVKKEPRADQPPPVFRVVTSRPNGPASTRVIPPSRLPIQMSVESLIESESLQDMMRVLENNPSKSDTIPGDEGNNSMTAQNLLVHLGTLVNLMERYKRVGTAENKALEESYIRRNLYQIPSVKLREFLEREVRRNPSLTHFKYDPEAPEQEAEESTQGSVA